MNARDLRMRQRKAEKGAKGEGGGGGGRRGEGGVGRHAVRKGRQPCELFMTVFTVVQI